MNRCARCIMPSTAQGVEFDNNGMCRLCRDHKEYVPRGEQELRREIEPHVRSKRGYNCVVPVSGGRDSSYALYYAKQILGLSPLAVHNDNDFETETATRNLDTITQRLNVPLVRLASKKQLGRKIVASKFRMNAPFGASLVLDQTCEACQVGFESAAYATAAKNGIELILWGDSRDESTAPYHALVEHKQPTRLQRLLSPRVMHMLLYKYYHRQMKKEYGAPSPRGLKEMHLYDYIRWDQKVIVDTIQKELGWSAPEGAPTTWRIDCSLIPLVNYLTEKAYGVSKIELGFSNMVRNGKMDREDAVRRAEQIKRNTDIRALRSFLSEMGIDGTTIDRVIN